MSDDVHEPLRDRAVRILREAAELEDRVLASGYAGDDVLTETDELRAALALIAGIVADMLGPATSAVAVPYPPESRGRWPEQPDVELERDLEVVLIRYGIPADLGRKGPVLVTGVVGDRGDLTSDLASVARDRIHQAVVAAMGEQ